MSDQRKRAMDALKGLRQNAARARMNSDSPSLTVTLGLEPAEEHDPNAEGWDKVDDDAPELPGDGPAERKRRREG